MDLLFDYPLSSLFVLAIVVFAVVKFSGRLGGVLAVRGKTCSNCGAHVRADARYCPRCGQKMN
jgi:predicted Zn-ribbon and HTH transcriptional regulator